MRLAAGTLTSSKVMKVVPDDHTPEQCIGRVVTPGVLRSTTSREMPPSPSPPVRTAQSEKSLNTPFVIHFFCPFTT